MGVRRLSSSSSYCCATTARPAGTALLRVHATVPQYQSAAAAKRDPKRQPELAAQPRSKGQQSAPRRRAPRDPQKRRRSAPETELKQPHQARAAQKRAHPRPRPRRSARREPAYSCTARARERGASRAVRQVRRRARARRMTRRALHRAGRRARDRGGPGARRTLKCARGMIPRGFVSLGAFRAARGMITRGVARELQRRRVSRRWHGG